MKVFMSAQGESVDQTPEELSIPVLNQEQPSAEVNEFGLGDTLLKHFLQSLSRMYATAPKNGMDNISFSLLETLVRNDHSIMHERCSKAVDRTALSLFVPQCQLFGIGGSL